MLVGCCLRNPVLLPSPCSNAPHQRAGDGGRNRVGFVSLKLLRVGGVGGGWETLIWWGLKSTLIFVQCERSGMKNQLNFFQFPLRGLCAQSIFHVIHFSTEANDVSKDCLGFSVSLSAFWTGLVTLFSWLQYLEALLVYKNTLSAKLFTCTGVSANTDCLPHSQSQQFVTLYNVYVFYFPESFKKYKRHGSNSKIKTPQNSPGTVTRQHRRLWISWPQAVYSALISQ